MTASDALRRFWWVGVVVLALMLLGIDRYSRTEAGRLVLDRVKIKAPIFGPLAKVAIAVHAYPGDPARSGVPVLTSGYRQKRGEQPGVGARDRRSPTTFVRDRISLPVTPQPVVSSAGDPHDRGRRKSGKLEDMLMQLRIRLKRMSKPRFRG